jgi:hypothetical protein
MRKPKRAARFLLAASMLLASVTPAVAVASTAPAPLLPDLRMAPVGCYPGADLDADCDDWDVCAIRDTASPHAHCVPGGRIAAVRLRFTTATENVGDGPLLLQAKRGAGKTMRVRQAFQLGENGPLPTTFGGAQQATRTSAYYEPAMMHQHWHLLGYARYQLRTTDGRTLVQDRKNGFCLGDRYTNVDSENLQNAVGYGAGPQEALAQFLVKHNCKFKQPGARAVTMGVSVGEGDDYRYDMDFQWLDISRVPSGSYVLVNIANGNRTLREMDYTNNASSALVSIQWPHGAQRAPRTITAPPVVRFLRSCPGSASCP